MLAGAVAVAGGLVSSPSGQQIAEQAASGAGSQVEQRTAQQRVVNNQQQAQQQTARFGARPFMMNPYMPFGGNGYITHASGMTPKEYGEWLMRTGKDKQNARKRKHYAKMRA